MVSLWNKEILLCFQSTFSNLKFYGLEIPGFVAGMPLAFMYLTASRTNSLFSFLLGIPFERMIFYHKVSAYVSFVSGALHAYVAYAVEEAFDDRRRLFTDVETHREMYSGDSGDFNEGNNYALFGPEPNLYKFATTGNTNLSGTMIILSYAIIFMTSYVFVRRVAFEFFLFMHLIFAGVCLYYGLEHGVNLFIIVIFWALDVLVRILLMGIGDRGKQTASIRLLPGNIVELQFQKSKCFQYNAGQYVFLCIPKLSHLQWHPFSISSSPNQEYVSIHVKGLGGWTNSLVQLARDGVEEVQVLFDGPYGAPKLDLNSNRYKVVILFSGGIGVTPMFSLCNDLLHKKKLGRDIQKIIFVWSSRKQTTDASFDAEAGSVALPRAFTPNLFVDPPDGIVVRSNPTTSYLDTTGLLFSECYMTGTKGDTELILPGVTFGRPNLNSIFSRAAEVAEDLGERRVAVCVCGPNSLVKSVTSAAKGHSGYGVYFDVHSELFEF